MSDAYIYDAGRTAFGRYGGVLSTTRPDDLLGHVIKTLVERNDFDLSMYEDVNWSVQTIAMPWPACASVSGRGLPQ